MLNAQEFRIRVLYLIPSLTRGGAERQLFELLRGLDRSLFERTLVVFDDSPDGYDTRSAVDRVLHLGVAAGVNSRLRRVPVMLLAAARLTAILRREKPHVFHTFLPVPAVLGCIATRLTSVPVFIVGRRSIVARHRYGSSILRWIDRFPPRRANALVGNCAAIAEEAVSLDGIARDRAFTIYNGVDSTLFHPGQELSLRRSLGFNDSDLVFGTMANFHPCKRHTDFIHAAKLMSSEVLKPKFLMVGRDQGTLQSIKCEVARLGLERQCVIVAGTTEPEKFYRAMDVYVSASEVEGLSNSILEAMASARPVIATRVGGNPELVVEGETGFLVPRYTPLAIARGMSLFAENDELRTRFGVNARRIVQERFSLAAMVHAHQDLYCQLLDRINAGKAAAATRTSDSLGERTAN